MSDISVDVTAAHYMAGVVGLALLRHWYEPGAANDARMAELRHILDHLEEFPQDLVLNPREHSVADGYRQWSEIYDGVNPMIEQEEQVTVPWLTAAVAERGGPTRALDAGCGTGRQAALLSGLGADVVGVDATPEMLDLARAKLPDVEFREGSLDALPANDASFDLAVASLAICHRPDPNSAIAELARVVRPGGELVISEPHPMVSALGGQAFYGGFEGGMNFVRNHHHSFQSWIAAFGAAGVQITECVEIGYNAEVLGQNPLRVVLDEALATGFQDLPFILCFRLRVAND